MEYKSADRREPEDEYLHKIVIGGATTLAMACLKKFLAMLFVEQWRSRVFIVLNIVLVAIFVTSIRSSPTEDDEINSNDNNTENNINDKEKKKRETVDCSRESGKSSIKEEDKNPGLEKGGVQEQELKKCDLSKEELNEKVEAFILMFRQHLASDAKRGKLHFVSKTKQAEMLNLHRFKNSSGQLRSSTVPHRHSFCV